MGPAFELPLEVGAAGSGVEVEVDVEVPVEAESLEVAVSVSEVSDVLLVLVARLVVLEVDSVPVRDPIVVGSERSVGVAVSWKETWLKSSGERLTAVVATVVARCEKAPQPNWKKPPSKWF